MRNVTHVGQIDDQQRPAAGSVVGEVSHFGSDRCKHLADPLTGDALADVGVERLDREAGLDDEPHGTPPSTRPARAFVFLRKESRLEPCRSQPPTVTSTWTRTNGSR